MAVVTLTFQGSDDEIVSGIPRYISIESNVTATIYFTIDGSTPTTNSPIYTDTINVPTNQNSITLSAFGVGLDDVSGPILTQVFATDVSRISITRMIGIEGIMLNRADTGADIPNDYDADGLPGRFLDIDPSNLDFSPGDRGFNGIAPGTRIEVGFQDPTSTPSLLDDDMEISSSPEIGEFFNPNARVIYIDNRIPNDILIILRPYGSLHDPYIEFGGKRILESSEDANYVSGGFVKRFYNPVNNTMVSYYFDHNEARYVRNIQNLPSNIPNREQYSPGNPLVFKWVYGGRQSSL